MTVCLSTVQMPLCGKREGMGFEISFRCKIICICKSAKISEPKYSIQQRSDAHCLEKCENIYLENFSWTSWFRSSVASITKILSKWELLITYHGHQEHGYWKGPHFPFGQGETFSGKALGSSWSHPLLCGGPGQSQSSSPPLLLQNAILLKTPGLRGWRQSQPACSSLQLPAPWCRRQLLGHGRQ